MKSAELRSTEEFMVGTDLGSVKEQLCDLKVSSYAFTTNDESVLDKYVLSRKETYGALRC